MKNRCLLIVSIVLAITFLAPHQRPYAVDLTLDKTQVQVYFSPDGGCTDAINKMIGQTKWKILVQAYSFTSASIAKALLDAHKRGVTSQVIQRSEKYSSATFLKNIRIPTCIDDEYAIAHNKIMASDRETVITGSFNFTKSAEEKNAENLLIIKDKALAKVYIENWEKHKGHSESQ
jgi:phosphatidylserine/phosphatidylglycerophosphate/cardiolipin synthase-like enzyme